MASEKETLKLYSMKLPSTFPRPPAPGLPFHHLSPQPFHPGCLSESSTESISGDPITAAERSALDEALGKLILPRTRMPALSPEHVSKLKEILQGKKWTIYQLASLRNLFEADQLITDEELGLEEAAEFCEGGGNVTEDLCAAL